MFVQIIWDFNDETEYPNGLAKQLKFTWTENGQTKTALSTGMTIIENKPVSPIQEFTFDDILITGDVAISTPEGVPLGGAYLATSS